MSAYVIVYNVHNDVTNPEGMSEYREKVPALVEKHGGRYISRGPPLEIFEGDAEPTNVRVTIIEFPSVEHAKDWYSDPEYAPMIKIRQSASNAEMILVGGL